MFCNKCGSPLPSEGAICKFCGAMMNQEQINMIKQMKDSKKQNEPILKSKLYGIENNVDYNESKSKNNYIGIIYIIIVVLFLILLAIIINVL